MIESGLFDNNNNPICQGQHFLFTVPDDVFTTDCNTFYGGNLGKEMKTIGARYFLIYVIPTHYLSLRLASCYLNDDMIPFTIDDHIHAFNYDAEYFSHDGIDLLTVDKNQAYVSFAEDAFSFVKYLVSKGWLVYEPNPSFDLSKVEIGYKYFLKA